MESLLVYYLSINLGPASTVLPEIDKQIWSVHTFDLYLFCVL